MGTRGRQDCVVLGKATDFFFFFYVSTNVLGTASVCGGTIAENWLVESLSLSHLSHSSS